MKILVGNSHRKEMYEWQNLYGNLGTLISIKEKEIKPPNLPFALDNGAYSYFLSGKPFDFEHYFKRLEKYLWRCTTLPDWILVPDKVGDRTETLNRWHYCYNNLTKYNLPLAFAVQDGMGKSDVPSTASVILVGGSTEWKLKTISYWRQHFENVHVARVNGWNRLCYCLEQKINSVDGTGFFRGGLQGTNAINLQFLLMYQKGLITEKWDIIKSFSPRRRLAEINKVLRIDYMHELPLFTNPLTV